MPETGFANNALVCSQYFGSTEVTTVLDFGYARYQQQTFIHCLLFSSSLAAQIINNGHTGYQP